MNKTSFSNLKLDYYREILNNGLKVNIVTKKDYKKVYVILGTNYGSIDNHFMINDKEYNTNPGIAHFLEHKLFEMPDGTDAFTTLSKLGVNSNAYTSLNRTCYLFSTTDKVIEPLKVLLDFVYTPYFTNKSVDKEKGIIASEINMYKDYPDHQVEVPVFANLYKNSTLANDIAGEVEDIMSITPEMLFNNYNAFYNPNNMSIAVVGNVDPNTILDTIKSFFEDKQYLKDKITRLDYIENSIIGNKQNVSYGDVILDKVAIGFKISDFSRETKTRSKEETALEGLMYILFSESSELYQKLLDDKIIMPEAGYRVDLGLNYRFGMFETDSKDSLKTEKVLRELFENLDYSYIVEDSFKRFKNYIKGQLFFQANSVSSIANNLLANDLLGFDYFDFANVIDDLRIEDIYQCLDMINKKEIVSSILKKKE